MTDYDLAIIGGGVTTARLRAKKAVSELTRFYPMSPRWTPNAPLPGGDFPGSGSKPRSTARAAAGSS